MFKFLTKGASMKNGDKKNDIDDKIRQAKLLLSKSFIPAERKKILREIIAGNKKEPKKES